MTDAALFTAGEQKVKRFKKLFNESSNSMVYGMLKKLPSNWKKTFKHQFLEDYELAPKRGTTTDIILQFNFCSTTYDQMIIPKEWRNKHAGIEETLNDFVKDLEKIPNQNPLRIHLLDLTISEIMFQFGHTIMFIMAILTLISLLKEDSGFFNETFWVILSLTFLVVIWIGSR